MKLLRIGNDPVRRKVSYLNNYLLGYLTLDVDGCWYFEPREGGIHGLLSGSLLQELGETIEVLNREYDDTLVLELKGSKNAK